VGEKRAGTVLGLSGLGAQNAQGKRRGRESQTGGTEDQGRPGDSPAEEEQRPVQAGGFMRARSLGLQV